MIRNDKSRTRDMIPVSFHNIVECRVMTPEYSNNIEENLLLNILGDESKLDGSSLATRNELFKFLEKNYKWLFNYWIEVRPNSENEIKRIHILNMNRIQMQWDCCNGALIFDAGRYDIFKFPQFGFDINVYK